MPDEDAPTQLYDKAQWLKPVKTRAELPTVGVAEGAQCFASEEGEIYRFANGAWVVIADED